MSLDKTLQVALEHHLAGRLRDAEAIYRTVLGVEPDNADALHYLGAIANQTERYGAAAELLRKAAMLQPQNADLLSNLGVALSNIGQVEEAEGHYRRAVTLRPDHAEAHSNLGNALFSLGRLGEAEQSHRRAVQLRPDHAEMHNNYGTALQAMGHLKEAERAIRRALSLNPDLAAAHNNLGTALQTMGRLEEAERSFRQALVLRPDYTEARCKWVFQLQHLCAWQGLGRESSALRELVKGRRSDRVSPFAFLALPETTAHEQYACASQYAGRAFQPYLARPPLCGSAIRPHRTRLRIGYLSADYYEHATGSLLPEILERHDRRRFEVYGYSSGPDDGSPTRRRIHRAFDTLRDIRRVSDEAAASEILSDGIDILVDLKGYTANNRLQIMALRPAPVQVSWLGFPGTLGHARLADYLIGDPVVTPLEHASHYAETLALMPHCYQPNDRQRPIGDRPTRKEVGLPDEALVFCCFNQSYKITPAIFDLWCRLLQDLPRSVLWILQPTAAAQQNLVREAATRGIPEARIVFAPRMPLEKHLGRLQLADLALDTFPVTSHTTGSDALWAGVPLLTLQGETFVSRVAASILKATGLDELIACSADAYYQLALELAKQPERLQVLSATLRNNRMSCFLFDSERFTRDLERLLERIWRNYRAGIREHVTISD